MTVPNIVGVEYIVENFLQVDRMEECHNSQIWGEGGHLDGDDDRGNRGDGARHESLQSHKVTEGAVCG